jgi:Beta-glucanase/Beta-glucan synthetase
MDRQRLFTPILIAIMLLLASCADSENASHTTKTPVPAMVINGEQSPPGKLLWSDEFNGSSATLPDQDKWFPNFGGKGWGNKQLEYDTANENAYQDGHGNLVLETRRGGAKQYQCWYGPCRYTSARITTASHLSFTYGRLEARIKLPHGQGIWPAFWLLGNNCAKDGWPACGEIDVMENYGYETSTIHGSSHGPANYPASHAYNLPHGTFVDSFHTFMLQWNPNRLSFFVDGTNYATLNKTDLPDSKAWVFDHPFNIILNIAIGGGTLQGPDASTTFPQKMYVDYVRLYSI